jgi:hypothetical protein
MTKTAWLRNQRRMRKEAKMEEKQRQADWNFKYKMAPVNVFQKEMGNLYLQCDCTAEPISQGEFCPICRLVVTVHKYMLGLFKEAAEGDK